MILRLNTLSSGPCTEVAFWDLGCCGSLADFWIAFGVIPNCEGWSLSQLHSYVGPPIFHPVPSEPDFHGWQCFCWYKVLRSLGGLLYNSQQSKISDKRVFHTASWVIPFLFLAFLRLDPRLTLKNLFTKWFPTTHLVFSPEQVFSLSLLFFFFEMSMGWKISKVSMFGFSLFKYFLLQYNSFLLHFTISNKEQWVCALNAWLRNYLS